MASGRFCFFDQQGGEVEVTGGHIGPGTHEAAVVVDRLCGLSAALVRFHQTAQGQRVFKDFDGALTLTLFAIVEADMVQGHGAVASQLIGLGGFFTTASIMASARW